MTNILVAGGAGYVGSHTCLDLARRGFTPVVYDNLSNGHAEFVQWGPLEVGDIRNRARLDEVFKRYRPSAIIHFAAKIEVAESVGNPAEYYDNNVAGTITLLRAAQAAGVNKLVFSSTCATYGIPSSIPINEAHPQLPISPYGRSKLMVEQILKDLHVQGFRHIILRYFNAAGACSDADIGERHNPETHAVPIAIEVAMGKRSHFQIHGTDYETRDGSCVRDFIHVEDLADAHSRAINYLLTHDTSHALNLGTGQGTTVRELLEEVRSVSGRTFDIVSGPRRNGDAPALVADNASAQRILRWVPRHNLHSIIDTAWKWHVNHPNV